MQKAAQASESRKVQQKSFYHGNLASSPLLLVRLKDYLSSRFRDGKAEAANRLKEVS